MRTIYRYQLEITDEQELELPSAHTILSVAPGRQLPTDFGIIRPLGGPFDDHIDLWAITNDSHHSVKRKVYIVGTGHPMPAVTLMDFTGTCVMPNGLVWHVFVIP
jgi:hypothetical protein